MLPPSFGVVGHPCIGRLLKEVVWEEVGGEVVWKVAWEAAMGR